MRLARSGSLNSQLQCSRAANNQCFCQPSPDAEAHTVLLAAAVKASEVRLSSELTKKSDKQLRVYWAGELKEGLVRRVRGWGFAPPRCAGQSVPRPLRPLGAALRCRCSVARHQAPPRQPPFSIKHAGAPRPTRLGGEIAVSINRHSTFGAHPLLPNPSLKLSPNSKTPGPRFGPCHHPQRGPGVLLSGPA